MESEQELRARARKAAEDKLGFYVHLVIYLLVNTMLVFIWWWTGGGFPWFIFILIFWGIGIISHGFGVFAGGSYADRMAEREYQKLKEKR
jgi:hypothetical protein